MSSFRERMNELMQNMAENPDENASQGPLPNAKQPDQSRARRKKIHYDSANISNSYANFFQISAIKEEVILTFGVDLNWEHSPQIHEVELDSRIILNPLAAKRVSLMLSRFVQEYEKRFQSMDKELVERATQEAAKATKH